MSRGRSKVLHSYEEYLQRYLPQDAERLIEAYDPREVPVVDDRVTADRVDAIFPTALIEIAEDYEAAAAELG